MPNDPIHPGMEYEGSGMQTLFLASGTSPDGSVLPASTVPASISCAAGAEWEESLQAESTAAAYKTNPEFGTVVPVLPHKVPYLWCWVLKDRFQRYDLEESPVASEEAPRLVSQQEVWFPALSDSHQRRVQLDPAK